MRILVVLTFLWLAGCDDPKAEEAAQANLVAKQAELRQLIEQVKLMPVVQMQVRQAKERVTALEKERDALKKGAK